MLTRFYPVYHPQEWPLNHRIEPPLLCPMSTHDMKPCSLEPTRTHQNPTAPMVLVCIGGQFLNNSQISYKLTRTKTKDALTGYPISIPATTVTTPPSLPYNKIIIWQPSRIQPCRGRKSRKVSH